MQYTGLSKAQGHGQRNKTGILLVNLGTPDAPDTASLRRYLAEFLSDPRVVELPRLLWKALLHGIILRTRPAKSAAAYRQVWTEQGSPLMDISLRQQQKLTALLSAKKQHAKVYLAMRYGNPSMASVLQQMQQDGVDRIVVLPLYPQYAAPTTGSVFDALAAELSQWRYVPSLHFIHTYHDNPAFITALSNSIAQDFARHGRPQKLVLSYHGMPEENLHKGDPYYCFCMKTSRLVAEQLGLAEQEIMTTFQSRFGKAVWLQPYTDQTMGSLPTAGCRDIAVACPAFSADCLETLEEIAVENRDIFLSAGGEKFRYIPCLNDADSHIEMMAQLLTPYLD